MPDKDKYKTWIGDSRRSDFEEYKRIKEANETYDKMSKAATADNLGDALEVTLDSMDEKKSDPVTDYIDSKTPKADYMSPYPEPVEEDIVMPEPGSKTETPEFPEPDLADFAENKTDITEMHTVGERETKDTTETNENTN